MEFLDTIRHNSESIKNLVLDSKYLPLSCTDVACLKVSFMYQINGIRDANANLLSPKVICIPQMDVEDIHINMYIFYFFCKFMHTQQSQTTQSKMSYRTF